MSDEEEQEFAVEVPQETLLGDNECIIFDSVTFAEKYKCDAVLLRDGQLWALDAGSERWREIAPLGNKAKLKTVKE